MSSAKPLIILAIPRAPKSRPNPSMEPSSFFVSPEATTFYHKLFPRGSLSLRYLTCHCPPVAATVRTLKEPCVSDSEDSDATDSEMLPGASKGSLVF
ncbi:hypothetical protein L3X38_032054 [Prunus dulcis]|uniref:Uncharacterized protein n=1 Tax=Prunus dulcis TaxID=3755 RepID=A0AAD4VFL3_PRUDU|nr:hypothetical protein L3X38_032054 [Prunus dulcis]